MANEFTMNPERTIGAPNAAAPSNASQPNFNFSGTQIPNQQTGGIINQVPQPVAPNGQAPLATPPSPLAPGAPGAAPLAPAPTQPGATTETAAPTDPARSRTFSDFAKGPSQPGGQGTQPRSNVDNQIRAIFQNRFGIKLP